MSEDRPVSLPDGSPELMTPGMADAARQAARPRSGAEHVEEARRLAGLGAAELASVYEAGARPGVDGRDLSMRVGYARGMIELAQVHATLAAAAPAYESLDIPWWVSHPFPDPPQPPTTPLRPAQPTPPLRPEEYGG